MAAGGKRPGAGNKKGSKHKKTIDKEIAFEEIRQRIIRSKDALLNAQMGLAKGFTHLYYITTNSKGVKSRPELVTDQSTIEAYLADELEDEKDEYYFMSTADPDNKAIDSMMDRAYGKAPQSLQIGDPNGKPLGPLQVIVYGDTDFLKSNLNK